MSVTGIILTYTPNHPPIPDCNSSYRLFTFEQMSKQGRVTKWVDGNGPCLPHASVYGFPAPGARCLRRGSI